MKDVTCWYRKDKSTGGYFYNHYSDGQSFERKPKPLLQSQNNWLKEDWLKDHRFIQNGRIFV